MVRVTSREIMEALGIKNVKTLTRWHQAGVIPEPKVELHPDGNGRIAYWPSWVLEHCRVVKQMLDGGQKIKDIVGAFGHRWQEIEARYPVKAHRRRYNLAEVSQKMDRDRLLMDLVESIYEAVAKQIVQLRASLVTTAFPPVTMSIVAQAVQLIESGQIDFVINTPQGRGGRTDGEQIRKAANSQRVSSVTTVEAALAAAEGMAEMHGNSISVRPLQSYHS